MNQFLIYRSEDGRTKIDVLLEAENLWLNQKQLTELFGKAKGTVSEHIKHLFQDGRIGAGAQLFGPDSSIAKVQAAGEFSRFCVIDDNQYESDFDLPGEDLMKKKINVKGTEIAVYRKEQDDYISLTDIASHRDAERTDYIISNWLRNRNTIEFLGIWEQLNNPEFKPIEFDGFKINGIG